MKVGETKKLGEVCSRLNRGVSPYPQEAAGKAGGEGIRQGSARQDAEVVITQHFNGKQQVFLDFVLAHYVTVGVEELDQTKLTPLLNLKYHDSLSDAVADLGRPDEIGKAFAGFQKYLYQRQAGAS